MSKHDSLGAITGVAAASRRVHSRDVRAADLSARGLRSAEIFGSADWRRIFDRRKFAHVDPVTWWVYYCAGGRHNMPPTPASWPLTFWPWKWCPSHLDYLCANFSLPRPLCSRLRPDVRDRQSSYAHHRLTHPPYGGGGIISDKALRNLD